MDSQNTNLPRHPSIKPGQSRRTRQRRQYNNSIYNKDKMGRFKNADLDTIDITLNSLIKQYKIIIIWWSFIYYSFTFLFKRVI